MAILKLVFAAALLIVGVSNAYADNKEDCLQDKDQTLAAKACPLYEAEIASQSQTAKPASGSTAAAETPGDGFFAQDWKLNPDKSRVSMKTVKNTTIAETHSFTAVDGEVNSAGLARVEIDLWSLDTNVDIRNVRMRFLLFETFNFPKATISAQIDKAALQTLAVDKPFNYLLKMELDLHGVKRRLTTTVTITRSSDDTVAVASTAPITITAADFNLTGGIAKLSEAAGGFKIKPSSDIEFSLIFEGTTSNPILNSTRIAAADREEQKKTRLLTAEECANRMDVISRTRQIYFRTDSAELDNAESAPVLDEVAKFANRCPDVSMEISGHTDSVGGENYNHALSERRANAVSDALIARSVAAGRLLAVGYGFSRPVADNTTDEGKAENRRIEFQPTEK
jgi:OmpA-OmpF porin, OOP family